ncbi:carboxypeptidase-2 [Elsinoe australis]|uniref:Carboxypeptidase-2 n=1 Tax=Elsinoe australis TaxID=40998 RepID=A0A4U7B8U9_9PEZI|nr:carboxypeptidase-2 [Elsinoe australis]
MRVSSTSACLVQVFLLGLPLVQGQATYGENYLSVSRDSETVSRAFPEVEGIELLSPAFTNPDTLPEGWRNGTEGPTSDTELDYFYRTLADRNGWLTYQAADFRSEEGRAIPYLFLSDPDSQARNETKLKVYIQAAIHGNEPAADQSVAALLGKMDRNQTWTASLLERLDIKILPRYNTDGVSYFQRALACNLDGNRDHIKLARQQSRDIKQVFMDYNPHISIDMHEFTAPTIYGGAYQPGADALISGGINPNIHPDIRALLLDGFIPSIGSRLVANGLRWEPYVTGTANSTPGAAIELEEAVTEARTGRNAYGLTQTVSFLFELRGIRLADQHFQRRVATGLIKLEAALKYARDNFDTVLSTIDSARADFISSNEPIVVTDYFTRTNRTFTLVNRATGAIEQVPVTFLDSTPSVANLTRARPEAYLIPRTWADVVDKLRNFGLEVQELDYEYRGTVEALNITSSELEGALYEGAVLNAVTTESFEKEVALPSGSFVVSTRQKNAGLAFIALEPENIDSFVAFNIIPLEEGDEYPVFRIL